MVAAAAGSDAAVVLVDITKLDTSADAATLLPQTRRHALLAQLLRVPSIVSAVNKPDAVADPGHAFGVVRQALLDSAAQARMDVAGIAPVSALRGDNVAQPLDADWYDGPSLLQLLESLPTVQERADESLLVRCSSWPATAKAPATSRARCGAASPTAGCGPATRCGSCPAAPRPPWPRCAWPAASSTKPRPGNRPPSDAHDLAVNEIGHVIVETQQPIPVEPYEHNRVGGALIVVDPASNRTSGALLVKGALP